MKIPDAPPVRMTRARAREMEAAAAAAKAKGRGRPKAATTTTTTSSRGDPRLDKENAGLRAKPVRRPAAPKGAKKVSGVPPLSPKKAAQVAKAASVSSEEDELNGGKTPLGRPGRRYGVGASAQVDSGVTTRAAGEARASPPSRIPRKRGSSLSESVPALAPGGKPKEIDTPATPVSVVAPPTTRARKPAPVFLTREHASPIVPGEVEGPKKYRTPTNPAPAEDASKYRTRPKSTPMYPTAGTTPTTTPPTVKAAAPVLTTEHKTTSKKTVVVTRETKIPTKPASTESAQQQKPAIIPVASNPATAIPTKPIAIPGAKPTRRPCCGVNLGVLKGAVIHVDCRTSDGEDASEIFRELVIQLGAKVVKNWTWMRQTILVDSDQTISYAKDQSHGDFKEVGRSGSKVAVTHVIFKDGSEKTLEKVRGLNGQVHCVGVRWLLDCERKNKWIEETDYAVDLSSVPYGSTRRRKSMEPRALSNLNGTLVRTPSPSKKPTELSPTEEFLIFDSPTPRRVSIRAPPPPPEPVLATPSHDDGGFDYSNMTFDGSPTTPYYLSKGAELVQQTCPPKQTRELLFPRSGIIEEQPNEMLRKRLLLARRKSLQWAPKLSSPLSKAVLNAL